MADFDCLDEVGQLTTDGEVWKEGNRIGSITAQGAVWLEGEQVGSVEPDGRIWFNGNNIGSAQSGAHRTIALVTFFGFFDLTN